MSAGHQSHSSNPQSKSHYQQAKKQAQQAPKLPANHTVRSCPETSPGVSPSQASTAPGLHQPLVTTPASTSVGFCVEAVASVAVVRALTSIRSSVLLGLIGTKGKRNFKRWKKLNKRKGIITGRRNQE